MTATADHFVACIPSSEEEMIAICQSITQDDRSVGNFLRHLESIEQLADVMREYLKTNRKERGG